MPKSLSPSPEETLRRVQVVTDAALAHLTLDRLLDELLVRVRGLLEADTAAILLVDGNGRELVATAAKGIEEEVETGVRLPLGEGFAGRIAETGKPVTLEQIDPENVRNPILARKGIRSLLGVPLIAAGNVIGVMHVGTLHKRTFTEEDVDLLQLVADRIALAVHARREEGNRVVSETLQRSLVPERLPRVGEIEVAVRYQPAQGGMVGGDWYDVFTLPSGTLGVVVGDVVGRGLGAAITMSRVRNALRALSLMDHDPGQVLGHVNDVLLHFDPNVMATVLFGRIDETGRMTYSNAGHPPPLFVDANGHASLKEEPSEPVLGAVPVGRYRNRHLELEPGSSVLLYTDGLIERRGRSLDQGLEMLRRAAEESDRSSLEDLCTRLMGASVSAPEDDVAVLALRMPPVNASAKLQMVFDAAPGQLADMRRSLRLWLAQADIDDQGVQDVLVAVSEAAANSIEHAYGPGRGTVEVNGSVKEGNLMVVVRDRGRWREPRGHHRGRGRLLMSALMDTVDLQTGRKGTTVTMLKALAGRSNGGS